jgi:hypothetical protein
MSNTQVFKFIDGLELDMSTRYYIAETTVWLLGAILIVSHFVGIAPSQSLPMLNVILEKPQDFFRVVATLLVAATFYLVLEWTQSSAEARRLYLAQARAGFILILACFSLWLCYPHIAANTPFSGISPAWYLGFVVIGFHLGIVVSILAFSSLMIRTPTEAKTLALPRVPAATRAQYKVWIPAVFLLLVAYYVLWYFSPDLIKGIGVICTGVPFLLMIGETFVSLLLSQDENGKRIPFSKHITSHKKIHDLHDYNYFLGSHGAEAAEKLGISPKDSPQSFQKDIQEKLSVESSPEVRFHVQQEEDMDFKFYFKDGNNDNQSPNNRGLRIYKRQGKKDLLQVLVIPDEPGREPRGMDIPTSLIEKNAGQYLSTLVDDVDLTLRKVISYAINQTVIQVMYQQAGLLHSAVVAGQEDQVEKLLKQDIDVNKQAEAGWTPLLFATAQGYPRIMRLLLDAGANPDIGNLLGITPLIYGARYGNLEACSILLEHGANTDIQDVYGQTALMVATQIGQVNVVKMLLKAGANVAIKDRTSMTALKMAQICKQGNIAKLLRTSKKSIQATN